MENEQIIQIPEDKFTINAGPKFLFNLIELGIGKAGGTGELSKILIKKYYLNAYSCRRLGDNLRKWQKRGTRMQIPLTVFLSLCDFCNVNPRIKSLRLHGARKELTTDYPIKLNEAWAFVSECIKVEGHLTKRKIVIENTNTEIISKLKKELLKVGIKKEILKEYLHIKIQIPEIIKKENIEILNITKNKKIKHFHERILKLKSGNKKEVIFIEKEFSYDKDICYRILYNDNFFDVNLRIPDYDEIYVKSTLNDSRYQKTCIALKLEVCNKTLVSILNKYFEIPYGNKSRIINIPNHIKNSQKNILKQIINTTLATESTVSTKSPFIAICSLSSKYLKDFQEILLKFYITSKIDKKYSVLRILGHRNYAKISKYFDFIIKGKKDQFITLLSRKLDVAPHGLATLRYLKVLENLKEATMIEILNKTNRTGNSFRVYIKELLNEGYIKPITSLKPKKYALTSQGQIFLKQNETYWLD